MEVNCRLNIELLKNQKVKPNRATANESRSPVTRPLSDDEAGDEAGDEAALRCGP